MQKLHCFVDETGQDTGASVFIVVALVVAQTPESLRKELSVLELQTKVGQRKWHKARPDRRLDYLSRAYSQTMSEGMIFFGVYQKPLPYFLPLLDTIEKSIKQNVYRDSRTIVVVDGIDRKKAAELTGALRLRGITLDFVRGARDESEPILRLVDRWAGCIRAALLTRAENETRLFKEACANGYLREVTEPFKK